MRYYIGIDGGGTKTALCAVSDDDFPAVYALTSGASWREHGTAGVAELLKQAVHKMIGKRRLPGW